MELSNYQAFMECMRKWEKIRHRKRRELTRRRLDERRTCGRQGMDRQPPSCPTALSGTNEIPL